MKDELYHFGVKGMKMDHLPSEFEDAKTRLKLENQKKKSKRQQDLEKKYLKQGFAKDEAEIKAYNRAKTETILKVAGGIALASAAAYVAYKHYDKVTDRVFEKGSKIDVEGFTKLGSDHIDFMFTKEQGKIAAHALANEYGPIGAVFATSMGAMKLVKRSSETKFVENYRKQHPESTLSNNEILKMRDRIVNA